MKSRIERVFSNLDEDVDAFAIATSEHPNTDLNFFYVTGITSGSFEHSFALVKRNGERFLFTSELEEPIARTETDFKIITRNFKDEIKKLLVEVKVLGINYNSITQANVVQLNKVTDAKLVDISRPLSQTRSIKDKKEIHLIENACKISASISKEIHNLIKPNITEKKLAGKITSSLIEQSNNIAFPTIVAFGRHSSRPHHSPTETKLKRNEFVLTDFGAEYNRYASDISRTFVFGKADKKMKDIYETVLQTQQKAIRMIKDGVNGKDVDKSVRDIIDRKYKGSFIHSLGHEVGLSVHDGNRLSSQVDFVLKEDMVVTVEPGIYIPSIGGVRIEDTILVTKGKPKILTNSSKHLIQM